MFSSDDTTFVYVIQTVLRDEDDDHPHFIKVGVSRNVESRLAQLNTSSARKHGVVWSFRFEKRQIAFEVERRCHELLRKDRQNGEWFEADPTNALTAIFDAIMLLKMRGVFLDFAKIGFSDEAIRVCLGSQGDGDRRWRNRS